MLKARAPLWWYDLRYGIGWRAPVLLGAIVILIVVAARHGALSPEALAERQRQLEEQCVARGGHVVVTIEKFGVSRNCYGADGG